MTRLNGEVAGAVAYREGDGILMEIPIGPCEIEIGELDVTVTWFEDQVRCATAMPRTDYEQYVADGVLVLG